MRAAVDARGCRCARLDLMGEIVERRRAEGGKRMSDAPTFGRYAEIPVDRMTPDQMKGYRSMIDGPRGRLPGPYKVWVHNPKLLQAAAPLGEHFTPDRKSTRLNSSHLGISYA